MTSRTVLSGEPQLSGSTLYWSALVTPDTFEGASGITDSVDCFRMTSDDPAGLNPQSEITLNGTVTTDGPILPGDAYQQQMDLAELRDGYYHVLLTLDDGEVYNCHVTNHGGSFELKSWHRHM